MLVFGDETRNFFLVIGQAVDDVRLAQNLAQMNDVILSPNCWQLCDRSMIEIERIPDQRAVKVGAILLLVESSIGLCQGCLRPPPPRPRHQDSWLAWDNPSPIVQVAKLRLSEGRGTAQVRANPWLSRGEPELGSLAPEARLMFLHVLGFFFSSFFPLNDNSHF